MANTDVARALGKYEVEERRKELVQESLDGTSQFRFVCRQGSE